MQTKKDRKYEHYYKIDCHGKLDICEYLCLLNFEVFDNTGSLEIERCIIKHKKQRYERKRYWNHNMATCCSNKLLDRWWEIITIFAQMKSLRFL